MITRTHLNVQFSSPDNKRRSVAKLITTEKRKPEPYLFMSDSKWVEIENRKYILEIFMCEFRVCDNPVHVVFSRFVEWNHAAAVGFRGTPKRLHSANRRASFLEWYRISTGTYRWCSKITRAVMTVQEITHQTSFRFRRVGHTVDFTHVCTMCVQS